MNIFLVSKVAYRALGRNKMRSLLTVLGIIIGVSAVITMVGIGQGARASIQSQINSLGTNVIIIFAGSTAQGGVRSGAGTMWNLTGDDAKAIASECPAVSAVSPSNHAGGQIIYSNQNWSSDIQGAAPDYIKIRNLEVQSGTFFTDQDVRAAAKVCVLGKTVVDNLFGENVDPIGQTIRIGKLPFKVIGVLAPKGQSAFGQDQDDVVLMPYTTIQNKLSRNPTNSVRMILVSALSREMIPTAQEQIAELLRQRHKIAQGEDDDFTLRSQADIAQTADTTAKVLAILLGSIASVSLVVGGIGIMNIMLVSVTERTREIGIRMAVGARGRDILLQFLVEAIVLSSIGGLIGVGLGLGGSKLISTMARWPTLVSPGWTLLALLVSVGVGVFFGFYPARKAAKLDPIEALRYE